MLRCGTMIVDGRRRNDSVQPACLRRSCVCFDRCLAADRAIRPAPRSGVVGAMQNDTGGPTVDDRSNDSIAGMSRIRSSTAWHPID